MKNSYESRDPNKVAWRGQHKGASIGDPMLQIRAFKSGARHLNIKVDHRPMHSEFLVSMEITRIEPKERGETAWEIKVDVYQGHLQDYWGDKKSRLKPIVVRIPKWGDLDRPARIFPDGVPEEEWEALKAFALCSEAGIVWWQNFRHLSPKMEDYEDLARLGQMLHVIQDAIAFRDHCKFTPPVGVSVERIEQWMSMEKKWVDPILLTIDELKADFPTCEI